MVRSPSVDTGPQIAGPRSAAGLRAADRGPRTTGLRWPHPGTGPKCASHLGTGHFPPGSNREIADFETAESDSFQRGDLVSDRLAETPDLAVLPLGQLDEEVSLSPRSLADAHLMCWKVIDARVRATSASVSSPRTVATYRG